MKNIIRRSDQTINRVWWGISILLLAVLLVSCSDSATPTPTNTEIILPTIAPTFTPLPPTEIPSPTPTIQLTPPDLPPMFTTSVLDPYVTPHVYIQDTCQYLQMKWNPNNSPPGTIVIAVMFHSIIKGGVSEGAHISDSDFERIMNALLDQGFEAITTEQMANFMEYNAKIPSRSVILIVDDRHYADYFNTYFRPYWNAYGWPVVNGWISHPETWEALWADNENLAAEGWVDYQAHGVIHNIPMSESSTEDFIRGELYGSITAIQEHFGKTPIAIVWPGGGFALRPVEVAREAGYRLGFTINQRGPVMFNWVPLADTVDPGHPIFLAEGPMNDPLMVLPRYWPTQILTDIDKIRNIGKDAAAYAESVKETEISFYNILCAPAYGPIPELEE